MKNTTFKMSWHRAFTLIELMIVIVILGILMATILPRVTGGQARARDTGRIADLSNIEQALNLYNVDYGSFPVLTTRCLYPSTTAEGTGGVTANDKLVLAKLEGYMKGNKIPSPSGSNAFGSGTEGVGLCTGAYYYAAIPWRGTAQGAYLLGAALDTFQLANSQESTILTATTVAAIAGYTDATLQTAMTTLKQTVDSLSSKPAGDYGYFTFGTQ